MKEIDINKIKLEVEPYCNTMYYGIDLIWTIPDIGWGHYNIYRSHNSDIWHADAEGMDSKDKTFLKKLLEKFVEEIEVD